MSKKVLITGVTGFVGSRLAERCIALGYDVHAIIRRQSNCWRIQPFQNKMQLHEIDLQDEKGIEVLVATVKPEWVFHLACYGGFPQENDEQKILQINTLGTYYLLHACAQIEMEKFIYVGSSSEYGIKNDPMKESDVERPNNLYGCAKLAATNITRLFAEQKQLPTTILRIFSAYGPYESIARLVPSVILACLNKTDLKLTSGKQPRDFIYVADIVDALLSAADKSLGRGEIYNLGSGRQTTVREMVSLIVELCGHSITPQWGAMPDRANEPISWVADMSKLYSETGWQPRYSLKEGLQETIKWFQQSLDLYGNV